MHHYVLGAHEGSRLLVHSSSFRRLINVMSLFTASLLGIIQAIAKFSLAPFSALVSVLVVIVIWFRLSCNLLNILVVGIGAAPLT